MKAAVSARYGSPDIIEIRDIDIPKPRENEVLVKVHSVSLNASDIEFLRASPAYIRIWGPFKPRYHILGSDIAGTITGVGSSVQRFKTGDEVYGDILFVFGGLAEYVCVPEKHLSLKPGYLSFAEAAAIPQAGSVALQGLRDKGSIKEGDHVVINGAGGGSGSFAIQLAKMYCTTVTAIDHGEKFDLMRQLGADHLIDYTKDDFTDNHSRYDLILDFVASHSILDYKRSLRPSGRYVMVGGHIHHIFQAVVPGRMLSQFSDKSLGMLAATPNKDLELLASWVNEGLIKCVIDRTYSFEEVREALWYMEKGKAQGKVIIRITKT